MTINSLTKYPAGGVRELFSLSVPIFFSIISSNLMLFCDRYFLSQFSLETFNAVGVASYLVLLFQIACIRFSSISQVFIGRCLGNKTVHNIGPYTWQMIWGSLLTFFIITPIGIAASEFYFTGIENGSLGKTYFLIMLFGNFLFPLGATLAAFQLGLGKTKILSIAALISNFLNIILDYYLINGISNLLDPMGVKGAAIATLISQGTYCAILFFLFINHPLKNDYKTKDFYFRPALFKESSLVGFNSAFAKVIAFSIWTVSINIVAVKGGDYVTLISFGSTICILFSIISEPISKGLIILFSYFLGQNNWRYILKSFRSGVILMTMAFGLLTIPFVIYNRLLIEAIIGTSVNETTLGFLQLGCYWLWIYFLIEGISFCFINLIIAMKETYFSLKIAPLLSFSAIYLPFYLSFKIGSLNPDKIWVIVWINYVLGCLIYSLKIFRSYKKSQEIILKEDSI